ncbi:hypothetical protein ACIOD0_01200 [Kitasatospora albolonga]
MDHDLVGEGRAGGGDGAGVADGDLVAGEAACLAEDGGEVDRAEDQQAGRGGGNADQHRHRLGARRGIAAERAAAGPQQGLGVFGDHAT